MQLNLIIMNKYNYLLMRKMPDGWVTPTLEVIVLIGDYSHPSKCGYMRLVPKDSLNLSTWGNKNWRKAKGLEIDLFWMGVKRLPTIINI
jgi:hypothetical protein